MMNRASLDVHRSHNFDEEANAKHKYQTLANEFLELQKEIVSKKRKLKTAKTKRDKLFTEVRFLRRRHKYLTQTEDSNKEKDLLYLQNADGEINPIGNACEAAARNSDLTLFSNSYTETVEDGGRNPVIKKPGFAKPPKNGLVRNKAAAGKRKISQLDHFTLQPKFGDCDSGSLF